MTAQGKRARQQQDRPADALSRYRQRRDPPDTGTYDNETHDSSGAPVGLDEAIGQLAAGRGRRG